MSAFLQSGCFYPGETPIFRVRFRPKAAFRTIDVNLVPPPRISDMRRALSTRPLRAPPFLFDRLKARLDALGLSLIMLNCEGLRYLLDAKSTDSACGAGAAFRPISSPQHWSLEATNPQGRKGNGGKRTIIRICH